MLVVCDQEGDLTQVADERAELEEAKGVYFRRRAA